MRLAVNKTYKMMIGGAFVRSESNRSLVSDSDGSNYPRATRKDVRDAVKSARGAFTIWSGKTAYNRGQILYRLAEMLEARFDEFEKLGVKRNELQQSVDRLVYYAGWSDKYQQLIGSVNPVAAPYFNFSVPEPVGVIGLACAEHGGLLNMVSLFAPCLVGGNTMVMIAPDHAPIVACEFCEIIATSDVPPGVVNILTGRRKETLSHLAKHMDVNTLLIDSPGDDIDALVTDATENLKRLRFQQQIDWSDNNKAQGLSWIEMFQEIKTVWHPIGV